LSGARANARFILRRVNAKLYKAVEVCELLQVQPYVLRSWEKEFPGIGVRGKSPDSPRLYRQSDLNTFSGSSSSCSAKG